MLLFKTESAVWLAVFPADSPGSCSVFDTVGMQCGSYNDVHFNKVTLENSLY